MKISIAQIRPIKGNIADNIRKHVLVAKLASSMKAKAVFFPDLSSTGFEPELAQNLATTQEDIRLNVLQQLSNTKDIAIGIGLPTRTQTGILINMVIFQTNLPTQTYSKQQLHSDEIIFFEKGNKHIIFKIENMNVAPAICYESLQKDNSQNAFNLGAEIYVASVAKSESGLQKAFEHYPEIAKKIFISNTDVELYWAVRQFRQRWKKCFVD